MTQNGKNDLWKKITIIGTLVASIAIPLAIALIGHWYTSSLKEKEFGVRYVELAISILSEEPQEHTQGIRKWAIDVVSAHSIVKISDEAKTQLLNNKLRIRTVLEGHKKNSTELLREVNALQKQRQEKNKEMQSIMKKLRE